MKDKYVFYDVDGERFSVRESEMSEFEKDFPNAIINMSVDGENFPVKLSEREDFLKDFGEGASYTNFDEEEESETKTVVAETNQKPKRDSLNNVLTSVNDSLMRAQLGANKTFADQQIAKMTAPAPEINRDMADLVIESHRGNKTRVDEYLAEQDKTGYDYDPTKMGGSIPMPAMGLAHNMYQQSKKVQKTKGQNYTDALIAQRLQSKVEDKVEQYLDPSKTFVTGAIEGVKDTAFDLDTWDSGMAAEDAARIYAISKKLDKGGELSEGEDMIIEALVDDLASDIYLAAGFGRGYKAGQVTGESLPFMVETMLNPASKFGESITKKFGKEIFKRVGRKLGVKAARAAVHGTRVLSDMAGAAMMSATTSQARVAEDALNRLRGQVDFEINEDGTLGFKGFVGGEDSAFKAYAKAYGANTIEHFSEMVGNYFAPMGEMAKEGTAALANKIGLKKVGELLTEMTPNGFGSLVNDFAEQTQWHGMIGEFAEEMVSGAMNALVVGDQTLKKYDENGNLNENYLFDKENMIDTFLGVAILGGVMSTAKTLGYTTPETKYNREISRARKALEGQLTEDEIKQLEAFAANPMGAEYANLTPFFDKNRKQETKEAVAKYMAAVMEKQGYLLSREADLSGTQQGMNEMQNAWQLGSSMSETDLYDVDEAEAQAKQALLETGMFDVAEGATESFLPQDVLGYSSYDLFRLSERKDWDFTEDQRQALKNLAIVKNAKEGLNNRLNSIVNAAIARESTIANESANNGVLTIGRHNDKTVFVRGNVAISNGSIEKPADVNGYPVEIVDFQTGETSLVDSSELSSVGTISAEIWNTNRGQVISDSYNARWEQWRNTKSAKSKLAEIQNFVGEKVYIKTANNDMTEVEVQQILPNGEVLIKGKKGDLGGQSTIRVDVDSFYDSMSRDANGNPIFNQSEFRSQTQGIADAQNRMYVQGEKARDARKPNQPTQTPATEQEAPQADTPQEQTPEPEVPQTPVEPTEPADFRDFADTIMVNGKRIKVDEVTAQDDVSDSITYRYTDENGVQRTGNSTIGAFAEAVNLARQQTETPAPAPTAVGETTVPPTEQTIETPTPTTAPAPTEQTEQTPVDWETMLDFEPENYLAEMQNRYGDKTVKMLNAVLSATQRQLDKLNKATPEAHEEILQNEVKKDILQARIDKLGEMVARLSTFVTPEAPAETAPVAETPVGETPAPTADIPIEPVNEPTPAPVAETPEVPVEQTPTPVAPNPVTNPIDEARKKERQLATNLKKIGLSPEHKQDLAYNAGKAIADMFATREEYDAYAESATDFGSYNADFERGVDDSFATRNQQNTGNTPVNSVPLENEPNGENNGTEGAAANEDVQGRGSDNGSTGTDNGRGEEGVPQVSEEQPTHEGEAGADEALEDKYPARKGDVKPSDFADVFGFKSVDATLPQHILNSTYDMLMEIAKMLGISPKSITHGGTLELGVVPNSEPDSVSAVYAANGRYGTPVTKAIMELRDGKNLSAIAHEWWHSLDHVLRYWNSGRGRESASNATAENFDGRPEVLKAIKGVLSAIRKSGHVDRIKGLNFSSSHIDYLKSKKELGARAFEEYIIGKLAEAGIEIEGVQKDDWVAQPTAEEMAIIAPAFDNLFKILQEKEGKTPGTSVLFHIGQEADERINNLVSEEATDLTNEVIDISLEGANIDVERPSDEQTKEVLALGGLENEYSIGGNNPIFISNAALAVQQIKQEKATPEQWLKMIEKAGGLKAGEDKWMGLSDWLKAQDAKTLTKQEVLDFINENTIRIEEVNYVAQIELEEEEQKQLDAMNEEFLALREQAQDAGEWIADAGEIAYQLMADKYGDDFTIGFGVDNGELYVSNLEAAASITGIEPRSEREINDTRLRYTTEGLDNKKEIAIIIPTIDKWNQYDEIHFGDAGDGRAVAWVRFGDAKKLVSTTETIVIEEFEKPFKNYKGWDVYKPLGRKDDHMYISAGTLKDGRFVYGVFVKDTAIGAYESFDEAKDALNKYLAENPSKRFVNKRVLVIDEIQSKRHQEGRERGYKSPRPTKETERLKALNTKMSELREQQAHINDEIAREKENEDIELARIDALLDNVMNIGQYDELTRMRENIERKRSMREDALYVIKNEIMLTQSAIWDEDGKISRAEIQWIEDNKEKVADAPFDKNWHELAMKRMLRYAAENGYDVVAWTKGEQQAERYSLTKYFNGIAREDNPSVAGKRFQLYGGNVETIVVNDAGVVTDSTIDEAKGKSLSDVVGKEVADKMMTIEDGDSLGDADIAIGGEGMKGFYDKMLPTFINKYGKKWGVKAEEIKLNGLEYGEVYMHSVPVNDAMKESVMEGQPMFFKTPKGIVYGWTDGKKIYLTKAGMNPNTKIHEYTHIWAKAMMQKNPKGWNSIKQLLKNTPIWNEVMNDANYSNIHGNEDAIASEALSRISGTENAAKLEQMAQQMIDEAKGTMRKAEARGLIQNMKDALTKFWNWVGTNLFGIENFESVEQVTDRVLYDLLNKTDLKLDTLSEGNVEASIENSVSLSQETNTNGYEGTRGTGGGIRQRSSVENIQTTDGGRGEDGRETQEKHESGDNKDVLEQKYPARNGNASQQLLKDTFGLSSVEIPESEVNTLNRLYDFMMEMSKMLGISPKSIGQGGWVEIENLPIDQKSLAQTDLHRDNYKAIGVVMRFKNTDSMPIAHEWWHSLDYALPIYETGEGILTALELIDDEFDFDVREETKRALKDFLDAITKSGYIERIKSTFAEKKWDYYLNPSEMAGRAFDIYIRDKFADAGIEIEGLSYDYTNTDASHQTQDEMKVIAPAIDNLLKVLHENDGKIAGTSILRRVGDSVDSRVAAEKQNAAVDYLAGHQRNEAIQRVVNEEAAKLNVNVTYATREQMPKGLQNDKGYFNTKTGEIVICTENNASIADAIQTILHEAVAHKGLRQLMGDKFNEFINRVYDSLDAETKAKVDALAESKYHGNTAVAMEEYMASLAETENFAENSVWDIIKSAFERIINAILGRNDIKIGDNELRYILRASYNNMVNPRNMETIRGWAQDQMMREDYKINHVAPELLSRTGIDPTQVATQTASLVYDQVVNDSWQEFQRQFQDAMQPVRIAIDAIQQETGNIPIEDYENYILIQNQSSSRSRVEIDDFARRYYSPIIEQVNKVIDTILESRGYDKNDREKRAEVYKEVKTYLIAKHGIERNAYYQTRNTRKITAKTKAERIKSVREDHKDIVDQIKNDPTLSPSEKANLIRQEKKRRDTLINQIRDTDYELDVRDYSGLTALFGFRPEQYLEAEAEAEKCVEQFENAVATDELWAKIKSATDKTLRHSYESGLLSRQQYNDIKNMFEYYIPLRGFDESTAEDVYAYARFEGNRFNPAVHKAEGRTSLADDPIAIIMNMAESEIAQGNKNRAKQALYNYLLNRSDGLEKQNSLMQIESVWAIKTIDAFGNEVYVIASPDHAAGETLEEFEERMQVMAEAGLAKKSQKGHVDVGMRFQKPSNKDAHYVYLKVNGVEKAIYINGNPKAADAINGTYAPMPSEFMQKVKDVQRLVSSTFTNYSLEFTARNYFRDMVYSHINIGVRESDPAYRKKFRQNWRRNNMGTMLKMLKAYRAGEFDGRPLTADEAAFVEFMNNGGQTGYTLINSVETHKKELERAIERMQNGIVKGGVKDSTIFRYTLGGIELLNEASELVTRFATFKTSRDMGRGINRSISDAKEVTVNFNTKGAQDGTGWMGVVARYLGAVKYFFNASVQGVQNLGAAFQKNKLKFGTVVGSTIGLGMMMPILQGALSELIGGDEDEYWNIPEYDRQNNLCFVIGKGKYVKLPLPIGFREMYGLGDLMMAGILYKKFARSPLSVGMDVANKIATVVLPINPLEGSANGLSLIESGQDMLLPDFTQGMVQNRTNTDFKGVPIQKEYTYNENNPQWTKAFANNPSWLTGLSKWCYEHLEIDGVGWDWSPEKLDNTLSNAFGGIYSLLKKTGRTVSAIWNEDNRTLSNVPLVGVIVGSNIDDDERFVNSTYWEMDEYYNKRLYKIKSTAANFGLTLDDVFARKPEGERAGEHHPAMNKIYNRDNFDFMQEWYLGHKGEGETDENGNKILGLSQIKNKIKNLEDKIKKNEDGVATPEQDEELVKLNNLYEATRRDLVNDLLELD